jgi:hypothetical protein
MALDAAFGALTIASAPHSFFDALDEDSQMLIVNWALMWSSTTSERALSLRLVKKLFHKRLTTTHAYLKLCRAHLQPLREAIDRPSVLVHRLVQVVVDVRRTSKQTLGLWYKPFPGVLYTQMTESVWATLVKTKQQQPASEATVDELWRQMHLALRVGARQQLRDAHFDHPTDLEWCVERLCRVLRHMDVRAERGTETLHSHSFLRVSVRDRLTQDTPALPPPHHH